MIFQGYAKWVRENAENVTNLERVTQMVVRIFIDPRNLIITELSWVFTELHSFLNKTILTTAGRRMTSVEHMAIVSKLINELQCFVEFLLRRHYGHEVAWNVLLALQAVKCVLSVLMHRQLFLLPWVVAVARRWLRVTRRWLEDIFGGRLTAWGENNNDDGGNTNGGNARLVIPRVATRRQRHHHNTESGDETEDGGGERCEQPRCTAMDLFAFVVDVLLLLRPLLLIYFARRHFPRGVTDFVLLPLPPPAHQKESKNNGGGGRGTSSHNKTNKKDEKGLFVVQSVLKDGVSKSLLSNWGVWLSFFGFDALIVLASRYIRRYRVPVVFINEENTNSNFLSAQFGAKRDGELSSRVSYGRNNSINNNNNNNNSNNNNNNDSNGYTSFSLHASRSGHSSPVTPLLPQPPVNKVVEQAATIVSWDNLRQQKALRNFFLSFLRDPFFSAVLQRFLYDNFVVGRINRIPLLGSVLAYHVAYFLCKQHYSFMYFLDV